MRSFSRSDSAIFVPRMPEVEALPTLAAVFDQARSAASTGTPRRDGAVQRCVVIVTPGRLLMLQPCSAPGAMPEQQVAGIQKMIAPEPKRNIAAISYTGLKAVKTDISKAIPFIGILLGFAYIGHVVWVFEGHASALPYGCQDADVLLVDGGMLPHMQSDWQALASRAMRLPEIYIHDRATHRLSRPPRQAAS